MFLKVQILERLLSGFNRYFKVNLFSRQTQNLVQFHSGGDDYNPPANVEGLGGSIGDSPSNGFIFGWRDSTERKCQPGEKRLYAVKSDGSLAGEIYLKNDGIIEVNNPSDLKFVVNGNVSLITQGTADISASTVNISAGQTNLGEGGQPIARVGDSVVVNGVQGTITSGGSNTSI